MAVLQSPLLFLGFLVILIQIPSSKSLTCTSQSFTNNKLYQHCNDLPHLNSYLHWTHDATKSSLSIAFVVSKENSDGWISWAINPTATGMVGAEALIALKDSNGSMVVKTYKLNSYSSIVESKLSFDVTEAVSEYSSGEMRIFATISGVEKLGTTLNQVWQVGSSVVNGFPARHDLLAANLDSKGTVDLLLGQSNSSTGGADSRLRRKNIHGILNAVSWGILFPVGAMIARYLRTMESADPAWFYLHALCQVSAYCIGVAGWITGLKIGDESKGVIYTYHRNIGIALFSLATVQIFALLLRPKKDHKYRLYWNIYHHSLGYSIIILSIINVFKGLGILNPEKQWKTGYIGVIVSLGALSLLLEAVTWIVVMRRSKSGQSTKPYDGYNNNNGGS
ncbi:cytochrome b561 and DOMON domain-containing protein At4g12980-like [Impatiens glandulifera]|uniref:cytochrome b561 and DOMON domain-containing protein At4g12980-like n=1 Tax=Impatiens glandulifera TaxID=253017 RepID=UPI001FB05743|nr:cytochrome b561 and DOMON domain-containing protein At4g12980-like [Impatiens glandulifera]